MVDRVRVGLIMILLGLVGLLVGWQIEGNDDNAAVLAVLSALTLAAGCLVEYRSDGRDPDR